MWMRHVETAPVDLVPSWISAIATAVGVVIALVAILFTYQQVRLTAKQMRDAASREAQNSEDQTRPYIGIDIVPGLTGPPAFDLVITNFGRTTARDVRLTLAGRAFEAQSEADTLGPALGRFFSAGFDLAPGARRRVLWRMPDREDASPRGDLGAPVCAEIRAAYFWAPGGGREIRRYEERLRYDLTEYPKVAPSPREGAKSSGSASDPNTSLKNAANALRAIAQHVGEIRR